MTRARSAARADRFLTVALVVLSLVAGAFLSSLASRWLPGAGEPAVVSGPAARSSGAPTLDRSRIRIEVLNAARVPGLADRMTRLLRSRGFDVVNYGNANGEPRARTTILDRLDNPAYAREVARELPGAPIRRELAPEGLVDVTVVLGLDHARFLGPEEGAGAAPRGLERVRGKLRETLSR